MIKVGDKFRIVKAGNGFDGKKFTCTRLTKERMNSHETMVLVNFESVDYFGKIARYAVQASWCVGEPSNGPKRKRGYESTAKARTR